MGAYKIVPVIIFVLVVVIFVVVIQGCVSRQTPEETATPPDMTNQTIDTIISSFDETYPDSFNSVEDIVALGPEAIPTMLTVVEKDDIYSKWAAIYTLSRIGYNQDEQTRAEINSKLKDEFDNNVTSIRIMAAGVVTIFGDKEGIPVLIDGLHYNHILLKSEPPRLICDYSSEVLIYYTGQDFGYQCNIDTVDEDAIKDWEDWWETNKDRILWDDEARRYRME